MSEYIGNIRGCFIRNLYVLELGGSDASLSDLTSILHDNELLVKNIAETFYHRGKKDLKRIFDAYALKIRGELIGDGYIIEAPTNWPTPTPKIYQGIRLTATGKAIASELERAKDRIDHKIGKK